MMTKRDVATTLLAISVAFLGPVAAPGQESSAPPGAAAPSVLPATLQRWALLVGVDDYAELADLRRPSLAVRRLQSRLAAAGFPVTNLFVVADRAPVPKYLPSKANIERQVGLIASLPGENDLLVVVFCGRVLHRDGKSYLCPLDASLANIEKTGIDLQMILEQIGGSAAKHKLLVLDAVPAVGKDAAGAFDPLIDRWRTLPAGMSVWVSCGKGESSIAVASLDWTIFRHYLVRAWDGAADEQGNKDGWVSLRELTNYVAAETR